MLKGASLRLKRNIIGSDKPAQSVQSDQNLYREHRLCMDHKQSTDTRKKAPTSLQQFTNWFESPFA